MITAERYDRVAKAKAAKTHVERKHGEEHDTWGSTVGTGGKVNLPPVPVARYDGLISAQRLNDLARMCGKGGFVVHPLTGNSPAVRSGYAVSVWPERDSLLGGFVKGRDLLLFMIENWDLLWQGRALVQARRIRIGSQTLTHLSVVKVVSTIDRARSLATVHEIASFVDMRDGKIEKV